MHSVDGVTTMDMNDPAVFSWGKYQDYRRVPVLPDCPEMPRDFNAWFIDWSSARLAAYVSKHCEQLGIGQYAEDVTGNANVALLRALERFDPFHKVSFAYLVLGVQAWPTDASRQPCPLVDPKIIERWGGSLSSIVCRQWKIGQALAFLRCSNEPYKGYPSFSKFVAANVIARVGPNPTSVKHSEAALDMYTIELKSYCTSLLPPRCSSQELRGLLTEMLHLYNRWLKYLKTISIHAVNAIGGQAQLALQNIDEHLDGLTYSTRSFFDDPRLAALLTANTHVDDRGRDLIILWATANGWTAEEIAACGRITSASVRQRRAQAKNQIQRLVSDVYKHATKIEYSVQQADKDIMFQISMDACMWPSVQYRWFTIKPSPIGNESQGAPSIVERFRLLNNPLDILGRRKDEKKIGESHNPMSVDGLNAINKRILLSYEYGILECIVEGADALILPGSQSLNNLTQKMKNFPEEVDCKAYHDLLAAFAAFEIDYARPANPVEHFSAEYRKRYNCP